MTMVNQMQLIGGSRLPWMRGIERDSGVFKRCRMKYLDDGERTYQERENSVNSKGRYAFNHQLGDENREKYANSVCC
jgi:hypothetical protein